MKDIQKGHSNMTTGSQTDRIGGQTDRESANSQTNTENAANAGQTREKNVSLLFLYFSLELLFLRLKRLFKSADERPMLQLGRCLK